MFFSSTHHQKKKKKKKKNRLIQDWSNQAQFWQRRNGQKDQNHCRNHGANHQYDDHHHDNDANHDENGREEMILVGIGREEDAFELLSWAISIAARPGDVVIAFYLTNGWLISSYIVHIQKPQILCLYFVCYHIHMYILCEKPEFIGSDSTPMCFVYLLCL